MSFLLETTQQFKIKFINIRLQFVFEWCNSPIIVLNKMSFISFSYKCLELGNFYFLNFLALLCLAYFTMVILFFKMAYSDMKHKHLNKSVLSPLIAARVPRECSLGFSSYVHGYILICHRIWENTLNKNNLTLPIVFVECLNLSFVRYKAFEKFLNLC